MILLIDTINDRGCVGFYDGKILKTKAIESSPVNNRNIVNIIRKSFKNLDKIEAVGAVNGPGNFTGVRTGVVIANAIAYALKVPIYAIDTLTAQIPAGATLQDTISLLSASNSEVYFARFEKGKIKGKIEIVNVENNLKNRLKRGDIIFGDLKCEHFGNIQYLISNIQPEQRIKNLLNLILEKRIKPTKQALPLYIKKPNISKPKKK